MAVDVPPIVGGAIHWEARCDCSVSANDDVVLARAAVPFGKVEFTVCVLHKPRHSRDSPSDVAVGTGSVAIPAQALQIRAASHADECLDLLQALDRVDHLVALHISINQ